MTAETTTPETQAPASFEIDGVMYEFPQLLELDVDEWQFIYDKCRVSFGTLAPIEDEDRERERMEKLDNPAFEKALFHIGFRRVHPEWTDAAIAELIGKQKLRILLESLVPEGEVEADDPTLTTEPEQQSNGKAVSSSESSSDPSSRSSETQDESPATTGTSR